MCEASPGSGQLPSPGWVLSLVLALGIARLSLANEAGASGPQGFERLAIICSPTLQRSAIPELLAYKLQQSGFALVERDRLQTILDEQSLATVLGPADGRGRIKIGSLANARLLILMHDEGAAPNRRITVVVADCGMGARLSVDSFPESEPAEETATRIADRVGEVRARFSAGLKAVIGVPPFVSHNFTYEFRPLQSDYAALLREGLQARPGIAVVEIEEARSIRHELELAGENVGGIWPAFIDADFEVHSAATATLIDFTITIRTAGGLRMIDKRGLSLQDAAAFVGHDLPIDITDHDSNPIGRTLSSRQEFTALTERADAFAGLGEFSHSIDLRQAALALDPDSSEQQKKLSSECIAAVESLGPLEARRAAGAEWERVVGRGLVQWESALESLEWQLHRSDDPKGDKIRAVRRAINVSSCFRDSNVAEDAQRIKREYVPRMAYFLKDPQWPGNPNGLTATLRNDWAGTLIESAEKSFLASPNKDDLDLLLQLLNTDLPADMEIPPALTRLLFDDPTMTGKLHDFLNQLTQSSRPQVRLLSRTAELSARVRVQHLSDDATVCELDALRKECSAWHGTEGMRNSGLGREFESLRAEIIALREQADVNHVVSTKSALTDRSQVFTAAGNLRLEKLKLTVRQSNGVIVSADRFAGGSFPGLAHILRCNDAMTAFWDQYHLMLMRQPGKLDEVLEVDPTQGPDFADCQWDGTYLWIATLHHGLWQMDSTGTITAKIDGEMGLPPCEAGARIAVLGPGRLIVAGAFGPTHRAFIATIETKNGCHLRMIHKAVRVIEDQRSTSEATDSDLAFIPQELALCHARDGSGHFVIIRRVGATRGANSHPLIVDCRTFTVAAAATNIGPYPVLSCMGGIVSTSDLQDGLVFSYPTSDGRDLAPAFPPLQLPRAGTANSWAGAASGGWALDADGEILLMGRVWFRLDPKTWTASRLTETGSGAASLRMGGATHFGFVAWGSDDCMYRVNVDELSHRPVDNERVK